jgi:hypothetical protein
MFERNEQPGLAQRTGRPTDRQTNRIITHTFQFLDVLSSVQRTAATENMITFNA